MNYEAIIEMRYFVIIIFISIVKKFMHYEL